MNKVASIAINTFREAVRNRILYVLLFFSVLIMFGAWVASTLSIDDETKIVRDLGVGAINLIAVLITVFVGVGLVYNDLDKKTIYTIVSKPITRSQFLLGKYFGLMLTVAVNVIIMTWIFCAVLHLRHYLGDTMLQSEWVWAPHPEIEGAKEFRGSFFQITYVLGSIVKSLFLAAFNIISFGLDTIPRTEGILATSVLTILEMGVITAFAVLFSSFSSPTLSAFLTVVVFLIGRLNQDLYQFAETLIRKSGGTEALSGGQQLAYYFSMGAAYVCPNLDIFNAREAIARFETVSFGWDAIAYSIVYSAMVIWIAMIIFKRRNFK